jgi:uncharacterized protein (TIGR02466 family)
VEEDTIELLDGVERFGVKSYQSEQNVDSASQRILEVYPKTKAILLNTVTSVFEQICQYKKRNYAITTSWITLNKKGEGSQHHRHKNSFWSCVYYYQEEYPEGTGGILFDNPNIPLMAYYLSHDDLANINPSNSVACTFRPEPHLMLTFPSYLNHNVLQHGLDTQRKSIAFNIVPLGAYGENDSAFDYSWVNPSLGAWKSK